MASLDNAKSNSSLYSSETTKHLENQIGSVDTDGVHREQVLNTIDEFDEISSPPTSKPIEPDEIPEEMKRLLEFVSGLATLGVVLRNSEALDGTNKNESLTWLVSTMASVIAHDFVIFESELVKEKILKQHKGDIENANKIEHMVKLLQPLVIITTFVEHLATPKLGKLFEDNFVSVNTTIEKLLYLSCMLSIQSENCISHLKVFFAAGQRQTVWKEIAYFIGLNALVMKKWSGKEIQQMKDVLIDCLTAMTSTNPKVIDRAKMRKQLDNKIQQYDHNL